MWGFNVLTNSSTAAICYSAQWTDIVVIDKQPHMIQIKDVSIRGDSHVAMKETEKVTKYQDLWVKLELCGKCRIV